MFRVRGVTFIEVLIIVLVIGLLAAIVTPQFSRADEDTRLATLRANLLEVRAQIRLYRTQHQDQYPSLERFVEQMTAYTSPDGQSSSLRDVDHGVGPYLQSIPPNPYTGGRSIGDGRPGSSDWYYDSGSGLFRANHDPAFIAY